MVLHNGSILLCGGTKALKLDHGTWTNHSTFHQEKLFHSVETAQTNLFIFGGCDSMTTYEYLLKDSITWLSGKTEIPGGFYHGCAISVKSKQEIWLIGGRGTTTATEKRILIFNVNDHTFQVMPFQLNDSRFGHQCAFIPNTNKIMITGGTDSHNDSVLDSSEVLDTQDGNIIMASPMNFRRSQHGMGIFTIDGKERLAVFGGFNTAGILDSVEIYNTLTEKWEMTDIKMEHPKYSFGFLTVKQSHILSIM